MQEGESEVRGRSRNHEVHAWCSSLLQPPGFPRYGSGPQMLILEWVTCCIPYSYKKRLGLKARKTLVHFVVCLQVGHKTPKPLSPRGKIDSEIMWILPCASRSRTKQGVLSSSPFSIALLYFPFTSSSKSCSLPDRRNQTNPRF